ncbi:MAG: hypothetical protein KKA76_08050, partial [Proteobacteria bacterium]|nr:hypothetical protein [Pseudomonadota bacterium]
MNSPRTPYLTILSLICVLSLFCSCAGGPSGQPAPASEEQASTAAKSTPEGEKVELGAIEEIQ